MKDSNCIFCKILDGEIPSATLFEDDEFKVILDVMPASKGHALILPKSHYRNIYDLPDDVVARAFILGKRIMTKIAKILQCDGYNLVQNNEVAAGQTVFHFHIHMIPRYENDTVNLLWKPGTLSEADREDILKKWNQEA